MAAPHPLQVQLPATFGFSPVGAPAAASPPGLVVSLLFAKHALHVRPLLLRGSNGSCVMAPPQVLQVQFP